MSLPLKTTAADVRQIAKYLKSKPTGADISEAKAVSKPMVDGRKLSAYVAWGVILREDSRLKLTDRGKTLAREPEREMEVFREILDSKTPYRSVIEWSYHQEMDKIDTNDVGAQWHEHHPDVVGDANDNTLRDNAVCFFHVAEAAGLGTVVIGRGGKATRLDLNSPAVKNFVEAGPSTPPWEPEDEPEDAGDDQGDGDDIETDSEDNARGEEPAKEEAGASSEPLRVFISHGSNHEVVEQIETMLGLADITAEIAVAEETPAIPVPEKVLNAMRRCQAGIIAVTVDEGRKDEEGSYTLNENVLIEIGAAFVLYDKRVVLLWDKRLEVPSNLQGLYRCEFEGNELSWSAGMKLMKAIQGFKKPADSTQ
jgi:predicted nucleotide-binding protein